jgi:glycosyltransferase involved in cell wall biosynthesis
MKDINVTYFFRKPFTDYFSIEELFSFIQSSLPENIKFKNYYMKKVSKGLMKRVYNAFNSAANQNQINHITGDVHYISYFMKRSKTILTVHDLVALSRSSGLKRAVLKLFWYTIPSWRVKYITVISEFTKKSLLKEISFNKDRIIVIHDCISPEIKYTPKEFNYTKPNIFQVGTAHNKNLENVIPAIEGLNVKLTILGNLNENQKELLKKYNIDYKNVFNLDYKDVIKQYEEADIVTFTSVYEGFGLPIIEANGVGRPVLAGNNTSQPEIAGEGAILVDPANRDEIRKNIMKLIENEKFRNEMIQKGLKNVERFKPDFIARKYAELYEKVVNEY